MGETFLIHINCSKIIVDNDESQYTMLIDTAKMTIVYELIEWIRWIFSVENCVYLIHNDSVIHELEDIQLLSRLRNLEIKPCGRAHCIHKKMYRTLLSNFNLFVSLNKMRVHKYFAYKVFQMDQNLIQRSSKENNHVTILSSNKPHEDSMDQSNIKTENRKNKPLHYKFDLSDNQSSNSSMEDSPLYEKRTLTGTKAGVNEKLILKTNSSSDGKIKPKSNILNHPEDSINCSYDFDNSLSQNLTLDIKKGEVFSPIKSPSKKKSKCKQVTCKSSTKSYLSKTSNKHIRPFSVGEILSNIRKDFEKVKCEKSIINSSICEERNSHEKMNVVENFPVNEEKPFEIKKKQRTRKRKKKAKKQNVENKAFISSCLEGSDIISNFSWLKSKEDIKPNHIRFDLDDEDTLKDSECMDDMEAQNENMYESNQEKLKECNFSTFFQAESEKSIALVNNMWQSLSDSQLSNLPTINSEDKMEYFPAVNDQNLKEEKLIDLDDKACNNVNQACNTAENAQLENFNSDLNMLLSLKEKCKNSVVIQRF